MNTPSKSVDFTRSRRPFLNRMTLIAFVAGATLAGGVAAIASGSGMVGWHHTTMLDGTRSPAEVSAHVDHALKHFYVEIDATDAQKSQITPLVQQAVSELLPLHNQVQSARTQAFEGFTQTTVDRAALEAARAAHLQLADQASKRIVQLIADVGDVLTPAQRNILVSRLKEVHGMPRS